VLMLLYSRAMLPAYWRIRAVSYYKFFGKICLIKAI